MGGGLRNLLRRAFSTRVYPDLTFLGDNNALEYFRVGRLSGDALSLLNHGKLSSRLDGLDLVPSEGQVARAITMKGDGPIGLAQQFSGEVIAIGEGKHIGTGRRACRLGPAYRPVPLRRKQPQGPMNRCALFTIRHKYCSEYV